MSKIEYPEFPVCPALPVKVSPPPHKYESYYGFLMRIAAANEYPSTRWVIELEPFFLARQYFYNMKKNKDDHDHIANYLIQLVGLSPQETKFLEGALLMNGHIDKVHYSSRSRICPECVKENKYLDYMWEIVFASACPYHGIQLIDSCPECACKLSWDRVNLEFCQCGADLTQAATIPADVRLLYYNAKIWSAMGRQVPKIELPDVRVEILNQFDVNSLCYIFQFMFRADSMRSDPKRISEVVQSFEIIHSLLAEWPLGLYRRLDRFKNNDGEFNGEGLQQAFGILYRRMYARAEFQFIVEAFEAYVCSQWAGVIDGKYKRVTSSLTCGYTLIGKAAKKFEISRVRLNKLIDIGIVAGERKPRPSGRNYTVLKRCEVTRFAKISKHLINKKETCLMMGVSKREFDVLVAQKMIKPLVKSGDRGFLEWWCDSRKIKMLLGKLQEMVPNQMPSDNAISYTIMCQAHLTDINLLPDLLQSIITGKVHSVGMDLSATDGEFRLSSLYFDPLEITQFRHNIKKKNSSSYSIPEAAKMIGLKQEVAYHLVNGEFLKYHEDPTGLHKGRMISLGDIMAFEKTYVPLAEIARSRNQCPRTLLIKLRRLGVSPTIGGGADKCRQVFYRRSDLPKSYKRIGHNHT